MTSTWRCAIDRARLAGNILDHVLLAVDRARPNRVWACRRRCDAPRRARSRAGRGRRQPVSSSACSRGSDRCRRDRATNHRNRHSGAPHRSGDTDAGVAAAEDDHIEFFAHRATPLFECVKAAGIPRPVETIPGLRSRHLVAIVAVIELTTIVAILNCATRSLMLCRRAIHSKSVHHRPDVTVVVLGQQQPHRPVEPRIRVRGDELRAERRVAEHQQRGGAAA